MSGYTAPLRCKCRKHAETSLRCSRCNIPICPDCSKVATVGMLCRECTRDRQSPLYQVDVIPLVLSFSVCTGIASLGGYMLMTNWIGYFTLVLAFFLGSLSAEAALRITGRKRGPKVEAAAGSGTALGMIATALVMGSLPSLWTVITIVVATVAAVNRIRFM